MRLRVEYEFGNLLGPGWVISLKVGEKMAATLYDHEPTVKDVVEFVNECGKQIEAPA
jgi:hypothetical protein